MCRSPEGLAQDDKNVGSFMRRLAHAHLNLVPLRFRDGDGIVLGRLLNQPELSRAGDRFRAPLHLQFGVDPAVVAFDRVQGQKKPLPDLLI